MSVFTRHGFYSIACASKPDGSLGSQSVMVQSLVYRPFARSTETVPCACNRTRTIRKFTRSIGSPYRGLRYACAL